MDFVFVILHYNGLEDTIDCIHSIRQHMRQAENSYRIVVVDNASVNDSYRELVERYAQDEDVVLLHSEVNGGFAKGNNIGFLYAKKQFSPRFIVMLNNDTLVLQDDFAQQVLSEYETSRFAVLGPLVFSYQGKCNDNPLREKPLTEEELDEAIYYNKWSYYSRKYRFSRLFYKREERRRKPVKEPEIKRYWERQQNVILNGCFWIFSEEYIAQFDGLDEGTFLYYEEDVLYHHLQEKKLLSVYTPKIYIFHKEGRATATTSQSTRTRKIEMFRNLYQSLLYLKSLGRN